MPNIKKLRLKEAMESTSANYSRDKSRDKTLFDNEWLQVKTTPDDYIYSHEKKSGGKGVAVLAYRSNLDKIVGRFERVPCHHDGFSLCALTGQVDAGEDIVETSVRELYEEAGVRVSSDEMIPVGIVRPSKSADTKMYLFVCDIGEDRDIGEITGDGTKGEEGAYCRLVDHKEAISSKDPILATLVVRAMLLNT